MDLPELPDVRIEWDATKNRRNQVKHGIAFEEAAHVFLDPLVVMVQDRIEDGEERWQSIGMVAGGCWFWSLTPSTMTVMR
jgi:uncharacterized DUF497 family protein